MHQCMHQQRHTAHAARCTSAPPPGAYMPRPPPSNVTPPRAMPPIYPHELRAHCAHTRARTAPLPARRPSTSCISSGCSSSSNACSATSSSSRTTSSCTPQTGATPRRQGRTLLVSQLPVACQPRMCGRICVLVPVRVRMARLCVCGAGWAGPRGTVGNEAGRHAKPGCPHHQLCISVRGASQPPACLLSQTCSPHHVYTHAHACAAPLPPHTHCHPCNPSHLQPPPSPALAPALPLATTRS